MLRGAAASRMIATNRWPGRRWASGSDQAVAGLRFLWLLSELDVPEGAELNDALARIAAAGSHTRVGITPESGKRIWRFDPATLPPVYELPDAVTIEGAAAVLEHIRRRPGHRHPLEVHVSPRQIAFDIDHGMGDGRVLLDLIAAIFAVSRGRTSPFVTTGDARLALPRALGRTFGVNPARVVAAWRFAAGLRSERTVTADGADERSVGWSPSIAVALAHVTAEAERDVEEWRRANAGNAGRAAVWLYIVRRALSAAGLPMTHEVMVACDCRRYLSQRRRVNGNFVMGLEIPVAAHDALPIVATRLRQCTTSAAPLAAMGVLSARALVRARSVPRTPTDRRGDAVARVMYSDLGHITSIDELPWRADDGRNINGLLDPGASDYVTVFNTSIGATRNLSISFHDNVFDRSVIDRAAGFLKTPIRFLP